MARRVDEQGVAYAGSQLQIQIYVNRRKARELRGVVVPYTGKLFLEARDRSELSRWVA